MASNLYRTVGKSPVDNLTADNLVYQKRVAVMLQAPGEYKRGQVLTMPDTGETVDGLPASKPTTVAQGIQAILLEDVGEITAHTSAPVARTGEFNRNDVIFEPIPVADIETVIEGAARRQLFIRASHQSPFVQFGDV